MSADEKFSMKRKGATDHSVKRPSINKLNGHDYAGYIVKRQLEGIDVLELPGIDRLEFFRNYVLARKPCLIQGVIPEVDLDFFNFEKLVDNLQYEKELQVERKDQGGFGTGSKRVTMTLEELVEKFKQGEDLYLTTQYSDNEDDQEDSEDSDEEKEEEEEEETEEEKGQTLQLSSPIDISQLHDDYEDDEEEPIAETVSGPIFIEEATARIKQLLPGPLTNAIHLGKTPKLLAGLIPQQINLWMGHASSGSFCIDTKKEDLGLGRKVPGPGTSSGLHHDHSDNLYIPLTGSKRFTLFSPFDVDSMYTVGDVDKVYESGIIDYQDDSWRSIRSDGAMVTEVAKWKLETMDLTEKEKNQLEALIQEENVIPHLGDPVSFSQTPPAILHLDEMDSETRSKVHQFAQCHFPKLLNANRITVEIKPGQMLYLPTGWFHEVTSFGNVHMALNYWFAPPNGSTDKLYLDDYWAQDFHRTSLACRYAQEQMDA